jgi:cell division transport system permease protein
MSLSSKEYFIRETGKSIKRNGVMSIASVSTVAVSLLVLGLFLLLFLNTDNLAKYLESQVQMTVYMDDSASAEDLSAMEGKLRALPGVVQVKEVTKDQAMDRFRERLGDQASLLKALGTDNPFPASFEIQVDQPSRIRELVPVVSEKTRNQKKRNPDTRIEKNY